MLLCHACSGSLGCHSVRPGTLEGGPPLCIGMQPNDPLLQVRCGYPAALGSSQGTLQQMAVHCCQCMPSPGSLDPGGLRAVLGRMLAPGSLGRLLALGRVCKVIGHAASSICPHQHLGHLRLNVGIGCCHYPRVWSIRSPADRQLQRWTRRAGRFKLRAPACHMQHSFRCILACGPANNMHIDRRAAWDSPCT